MLRYWIGWVDQHTIKRTGLLDSALSQLLYLDTARLGQASPSAKRALIGALDFNQAVGASAYFEELLFGGAGAVNITEEFDGLELWQGIAQFSEDIKQTFFGSNEGQAVFASRTASLMSLAAKMLHARCSKVLVADLNWQPFNEILVQSRSNSNFRISSVEIKDKIFSHHGTSAEVIQTIVSAYISNGCDGIFLPAVCNLGVALPIPEILNAIRERGEIRFSVVDAAQAINHVDLRWAKNAVDFTFGGTHKWLQSYEPMALGYFAKPSSRTFVQDSIKRELAINALADPLLRITHSDAFQKPQTVNLCPLFAVSGALKDAQSGMPSIDSDNARAVLHRVAGRADWDCFSVSREFQSRIVLLNKKRFQNAEAGVIRKMLSRMGVAVTDYTGGICRISLPDKFDNQQAELLATALKL